jgi:hypothetical protein
VERAASLRDLELWDHGSSPWRLSDRRTQLVPPGNEVALGSVASSLEVDPFSDAGIGPDSRRHVKASGGPPGASKKGARARGRSAVSPSFT